MVHDPEVGAIVVGSPTPFHAEQIMEAAKLGKHVFCEKVSTLDKKSQLVEGTVTPHHSLPFVAAFIIWWHIRSCRSYYCSALKYFLQFPRKLRRVYCDALPLVV